MLLIDAIIRMTIHHANAIAQYRAPGNWTRRIDRKHRYVATRSPDVTDQRGYQRALSGSRWPGHADNVSPAGQRKEGIKRLQSAWVLVFNECRQAWQRASVSSLKAKKEVIGGHHNNDGRGALSRMYATTVASRV